MKGDKMKLVVGVSSMEHWGSYIASDKTYKNDFNRDHSLYLRKDGTVCTGLRGLTDWFDSAEEAQKFLDKWMPRKKPLTEKEVREASLRYEKYALDCSIEHWKQNLLDVKNATMDDTHCAICLKAQREASPNNPWDFSCKYCILNNYRFVGDCCEEYRAFFNNRTEINAANMLNKLILIRNKKYGNPYVVEEKKMANKIVFDDGKEVELSKETTERLRKELVKPEPLKAGDVVKAPNGFRVIVKSPIDGKLQAFSMCGRWMSDEENFHIWNYKKVGELKDYIK